MCGGLLPRPPRLSTMHPLAALVCAGCFAPLGELKLISHELILGLEWSVPTLCPGSPSHSIEDPLTISKNAELGARLVAGSSLHSPPFCVLCDKHLFQTFIIT